MNENQNRSRREILTELFPGNGTDWFMNNKKLANI